MTRREAQALEASGRIRALGEPKQRMWQLTDEFAGTAASWETGFGRVSLEATVPVQRVMASEMRRRPSWCVTI